MNLLHPLCLQLQLLALCEAFCVFAPRTCKAHFVLERVQEELLPSTISSENCRTCKLQKLFKKADQGEDLLACSVSLLWGLG